LTEWFDSLRNMLESLYLKHEEPWKQSGFSGPQERWEGLRRPIAECIDTDGKFLDIGCANGYLLECLVNWASEKDITIEPWGLDLSEKLVALAETRHPDYDKNFYAGNVLTWKPPEKFDYVRTELCYVPEEYQRELVTRLIDEFLAPNGRLLVAEYRSRIEPSSGPWVDDILKGFGFKVESTKSGYWEGKELTRVAVV
jgi:trans-aconitate methyltransferase